MSFARASPEVNPRVLTEVSKLTPPEGESNQRRDRGTDPSGTAEVKGSERFDVARSEQQVVLDVELGRPRFRGGVRQAVEIQLERRWEISQWWVRVVYSLKDSEGTKLKVPVLGRHG
jgi:hypothetical protein